MENNNISSSQEGQEITKRNRKYWFNKIFIFSIKEITILGVMLSLAAIGMLFGHYVKIAGSGMLDLQFVVLALAAFMFGPFKGFIFALTFSLLKWVGGLDTYFLNYMQFLLEYHFTYWIYFICGFGIFFKNMKARIIATVILIIIASLFHYGFHVISGYCYWLKGAKHTWLLSLLSILNGPHVFVPMGITFLVLPGFIRINKYGGFYG